MLLILFYSCLKYKYGNYFVINYKGKKNTSRVNFAEPNSKTKRSLL